MKYALCMSWALATLSSAVHIRGRIGNETGAEGFSDVSTKATVLSEGLGLDGLLGNGKPCGKYQDVVNSINMAQKAKQNAIDESNRFMDAVSESLESKFLKIAAEKDRRIADLRYAIERREEQMAALQKQNSELKDPNGEPDKERIMQEVANVLPVAEAIGGMLKRVRSQTEALAKRVQALHKALDARPGMKQLVKKMKWGTQQKLHWKQLSREAQRDAWKRLPEELAKVLQKALDTPLKRSSRKAPNASRQVAKNWLGPYYDKDLGLPVDINYGPFSNLEAAMSAARHNQQAEGVVREGPNRYVVRMGDPRQSTRGYISWLKMEISGLPDSGQPPPEAPPPVLEKPPEPPRPPTFPERKIYPPVVYPEPLPPLAKVMLTADALARAPDLFVEPLGPAAVEELCDVGNIDPLRAGYKDEFRGFFDTVGDGKCGSYCRWIGNSGSGGQPLSTLVYRGSWWSCMQFKEKDGKKTCKDTRPQHWQTWKYVRCKEAPIQLPKKPLAQVFGIRSGQIFKGPIDGSKPFKFLSEGGNFKQVSPGNGWVYGVSSDGSTWQCMLPCSGYWNKSPGTFSQIDAGMEFVFALDVSGKVYKKILDGKTPWVPIPGTLARISTGKDSIWGLLPTTNASVTQGAAVVCSLPCSTGDWRRVLGTFSYISSAISETWAVKPNGHVFKNADGSSGTEPWVRVPGSFKYVSVGDRWVWGIQMSGLVSKCKQPCMGNWEQQVMSLQYLDAAWVRPGVSIANMLDP